VSKRVRAILSTESTRELTHNMFEQAVEATMAAKHGCADVTVALAVRKQVKRMGRIALSEMARARHQQVCNVQECCFMCQCC